MNSPVSTWKGEPREALILLVEDSRMDVELTLDAFKEARLKNEIRVAEGGQEALDYLFGEGQFGDRHQFPLPDIILLDLKMPRVDGLEVLRQVKAAPLLKRIPVIILTSSRDEGDLVRSYDQHANSFLVKPVSFEGFKEVVRHIEDYWFSLNVMSPHKT